MKFLSLVILLLPAVAPAAEVPAFPLGNGEYLFAAEFTDAEWLCAQSDGVEGDCLDKTELTSVANGRFSFKGRTFEATGAPAQLAVLSLPLLPGAKVSIVAGNGDATTIYPDTFFVAKPAVNPIPEPIAPTPPPPQPPKPGRLFEIKEIIVSAGPAGSPCAAISAANPDVVRCEDFEGIKSVQDWRSRYGDPFDNCVNTPENKKADCIANLVDGGFRGSRSLSHAWQPGREGGTTGNFRFATTPLRRVTITLARRYVNFVTRDFGVKDHRISNGDGGGNFEVFGESAPGVGRGPGTKSAGNRFPWGAPIDIDENSCLLAPYNGPLKCTANAKATVGAIGENDVHLDLFPGANYDYATDMKPGSWVCLQAAFDGWGTSSMSARYWVDGKKIIDISGIDGTHLRGNLKNGVSAYEFVAFYNSGYAGKSPAERQDDNIVIGTGVEPVSCSAIGFGPQASAAPEVERTALSVNTGVLFSSGFELEDTAFTGTRGLTSFVNVECNGGARCGRLDTAAKTNDQTAFYYRSLGNQPYDSLYVGADFLFPKGFSFQPTPDASGALQSNDFKALIFEVLQDSQGRGHRLFLNFKGRGADPSHGQLAALASASEDRWAFATQDIVADGKWHRVEFEAERKPNGQPGRFRAWLDGQSVIDDAYKLCLAECAPVAELKVGAYVNFASQQPQHWFIDNVVFARSRDSVVKKVLVGF